MRLTSGKTPLSGRVKQTRGQRPDVCARLLVGEALVVVSVINWPTFSCSLLKCPATVQMSIDFSHLIEYYYQKTKEEAKPIFSSNGTALT
jgi:hypothetical protein